jgi:hypothetical protein
MHSAQRAVIEKEIANQMSELLVPRGFLVEAVLLKNIQLRLVLLVRLKKN